MIASPLHPATAPVRNASWWRDLLLVGGLFAVFLAPHLPSRALWEPDEGRYAEIAREMLAGGDFLTPRLNGVKYFEKPPLVYWLDAGALHLFGPREWALRLPSASFALLGVLASYLCGRALYGRREGLLAALVLATCPLYFALANIVSLDMAVSVLVSLALFTFLTSAAGGLPPRLHDLLPVAFWVLSALAVLTKGLIGIVLPALVIGSWFLLVRRRDVVLRLLSPVGILLFLAIVAPWHVLVERANPGFSHYYFLQEHFLRYTTPMHRREQPVWFFPVVLAAGMLPWTFFLPRALRELRDRRQARTPESLFLWLWAGVVLAFFSVSRSKLAPYVLPALPPLAILLGRHLAKAGEALDGARARPGRWKGVLAFGLSPALATPLLFPQLLGADKTMRYVLALGGVRFLLAAAILALGAVPLALKASSNPRLRLALVAAASVLFASVLGFAARGLDRERSVRDLAARLRPQLRDGDEVATFHGYYQGLPYYLGRRVTVAAWRGELEYGIEVEPRVRSWMIGEEEFRRLWRSPRRVFVIGEDRVRRRFVRGSYRAVGRCGRLVVLVNESSAAPAAQRGGTQGVPGEVPVEWECG